MDTIMLLPCQEGQQEAHWLGEVFLGRAAPVVSQHTQPEDSTSESVSQAVLSRMGHRRETNWSEAGPEQLPTAEDFSASVQPGSSCRAIMARTQQRGQKRLLFPAAAARAGMASPVPSIATWHLSLVLVLLISHRTGCLALRMALTMLQSSLTRPGDCSVRALQHGHQHCHCWALPPPVYCLHVEQTVHLGQGGLQSPRWVLRGSFDRPCAVTADLTQSLVGCLAHSGEGTSEL